MKDEEVVKSNFGLLRWMHGTHEALVEKVGGPSASKRLSDYVIGNAVPASYERQSIEDKLNLATGWLSRNNEALLKQPGDAVSSGEPIATVGSTGGRSETGLYFELRYLGKAFDPLRWSSPR